MRKCRLRAKGFATPRLYAEPFRRPVVSRGIWFQSSVLAMRRLVFLLLLLAGAGPARAQLSDEAQISLITILPGDQVYSLFGHSAVRVYDPVNGFDLAYNYGTFSFDNPLVFVGQFSYGKLDYFLNVVDYPRLVRAYWHGEGRPVIEQVLNLSPAQRDAVFQFLQNNARPEHKYYRYDFFFDNCSTRIRDALETALAGAVAFAPEPDPAVSFRRLLDPYLVERPFLDVGMDLGLGVPADRVATPREAMFLPRYLMEAFDHATVSIEGRTELLVARTDTVAGSAEAAALAPAWPWPSILLWGLLALGLWITIGDVRAARTERRFFDGLLFGAAGVAGLIIVFLWFISLHKVTHGNYNLLWAWPTHVAAAVALVRRSQTPWLRRYLPAAALVTAGVLLAWLFLPQALPGAVLPFLLLLAVRSAALGYVRTQKKGVNAAAHPFSQAHAFPVSSKS